jgi:Flp pilus assembly protein TadG
MYRRIIRADVPGLEDGRSPLTVERCVPSRRPGVAAVEFAVILPFVMMLFLGIIEFGRVLMVQQILTNAAREGCRYAVLPGSSISSTRSVVASYLNNSSITLTNPSTQVTVSPDPASAAQGTSITVTITVPCSSISWLPSPMFMGGKQLGSSVVMRLESNNT